ncbi:MAG: BspA family leucine-rich repeat surface protein, partial [Clostridia bacterium]|nr:BspA family leucine-rich repeat surface protein [Clostridia bacterium]
MKTEKIKKGLSLLLVVIMMLTMMPAVGLIQEAEAAYPVMKATNAASSNGYYKYYDKITSITFLDKIKVEGAPLEQWDMSADGDGSVWGWMYLDEAGTAAAGANRYTVYVAGEGGIAPHPDSTHFFFTFKALKEIKGLENLHTGNVKSFLYWFGNCNELETADLQYLDTSSCTSFKLCFYACYKLKSIDASSWDVSNVTTLENMFARCYALETANLSGWNTSKVTSMLGVFDMNPPTNTSPVYCLKNVDLTGWDTSNVTTMENMFRNCEALTSLDLSSFNTAKVTTMRFMFYYCKNLRYIYAGSGWTTAALKNLDDGIFNCCYAVVGQTDDQETNIKTYNEKHPSAYYPPAAEYAKFREDGGYLTNASQKPVTPSYEVTYKFIGDIIPEGVTAPDAATYEEGETVTVAGPSSAEHYIFSGWTTEDAEVVNGEFVINNDVEFVGSWTKLYKVTYEYDDTYDLPPVYPELPDVEYWYAPGEDVPVYGVPYAPEYIFVGWKTGDAEIIGDSFLMPENDVVIYGYYKMPVNSIEISGGELTVDIGGEKVKVEVIVDPPNATFKDVIFESGDESIVTVDKDGYLTPEGVGTTTITITSVDDPTKTDTVNVTVKIPVTDITVDRTTIDINKGDTDKITVTEVKPVEATNKDVTYESSNPDVVTVDEDGNIIAVGDGTAIITVTSKDNKTVKERVTVTVKTPVTDITVPKNDITVKVGDEQNIGAKVTPEDATYPELTYESDRPDVVKIDKDGNIIAVGDGEATITITSKDNPEVTETVKVTVYKEYKVTYSYVGDVIPVPAPLVPASAVYRKGETVDVAPEAVANGYTFSGWSTEDANVVNGEFVINNDVHFIGSWTKINYYDVTYKYEGEIPADAPAVPDAKTYEEGETVKVSNVPSLDGYTFTGWDTKDVTVTDGSFEIYKNVEFVGKWEKVINYYDVTYKYEGEIPADAPAVPDAKTYEEGETVKVSNVLSLDGYIFTGWSTENTAVNEKGEF